MPEIGMVHMQQRERSTRQAREIAHTRARTEARDNKQENTRERQHHRAESAVSNSIQIDQRCAG